MRNARTDQDTLSFTASEYLTETQIRALFSRQSAQERNNRNKRSAISTNEQSEDEENHIEEKCVDIDDYEDHFPDVTLKQSAYDNVMQVVEEIGDELLNTCSEVLLLSKLSTLFIVLQTYFLKLKCKRQVDEEQSIYSLQGFEPRLLEYQIVRKNLSYRSQSEVVQETKNTGRQPRNFSIRCNIICLSVRNCYREKLMKERKREKRNIRLLEIIDPTVAKAKFKKNLKIRAGSPEVPL